MPVTIKNPKIKLFIQWFFLAVLVAVLAAGLYYFVGKFESLRLRGYMRAHFRRQITAQKITPDQISGWMTFRYVNLEFNLPPSYLQGALKITNTRYPNLSLDSVAKQQKISSASLTAKTVNAVKSYHP